MQKILKKTTYYLLAFVATVSLVTVALGNTNILAQSCINDDGINCSSPPSPTSPTPQVPVPITSPPNNPGLPILSLTTTSSTVVAEPGFVVFSVSRSGNTESSLEVPWSVVGKGEYNNRISLTTAASNADFSSGTVSGVISMRPGESTKSLTLNVVHDGQFEYEREGFTLCINAPANASLNPAQKCADGAIIDKDALCEYPVSLGIAWFGKVACILFQNAFTGVVMLPSFILIILPLAVLGTAGYFLSLFGFNTRSFAESVYNYLQNLSGTLSYWLQRPIRSLESIWSLPPF